ncbi:succinate dehydrogenase iron-sulfur subunit [Thermus composti]|uniref:Fumarate reductase iron-sulfur subunit n=1 Tax=Thermus composti TaxID=532059 RepID=A0ABV6PYJ8_9DEIN|nr:succinate dehydrogenase iron-sulfur subunit [Thermus composti]GGN01541.1 succinate dehydrogenase iron-sulfur subunit [Thermus composti]
MKVVLEIRRQEAPGAPFRWARYVLEASPRERVLDLLLQVKAEVDGSLAFRYSCGQGVCGSDALTINGRNRLACKTLVKDVGPRIRVEPLKAFRPLKDLIVDMEPFFAAYRAVKPYLINPEPPPGRERLQSPEERARYEEATRCILCGACTSSCPVYWVNGRYIGPAAIVQAHRFLFDSRDLGAEERLAGWLGGRSGVWRCRNAHNCTEACPRGIDVNRLITEVKRWIMEAAF